MAQGKGRYGHAYLPTPQEIAKRSEEIRNAWSERECYSRAPHLRLPWHVPVVRAATEDRSRK
jgi:hypothetical protein